VRRPDFPVFELFNAAWCVSVRAPQPRGTQPRLRCSVVGLLRAPPAPPRLRFCRGSASCAFPALSPTRFGLLVATKPHHTSGGLAALRVPVGEGVIVPFSGSFAVLILKVVDYVSRGPAVRYSWLRQLALTGTWSHVPAPTHAVIRGHGHHVQPW
jgi:hypothetical protein